MTIVKKENYEIWKNTNSNDGYGRAIFSYAEKWADLMEERINAGAKLEDIAEKTSHEADTEGITGYMYGAAVSILSEHWIMGAELKA